VVYACNLSTGKQTQEDHEFGASVGSIARPRNYQKKKEGQKKERKERGKGERQGGREARREGERKGQFLNVKSK
jgi:hypothetical protein